MRTTLPTELVIKLIHATPEQWVAVHRALMLSPYGEHNSANPELGEIYGMFFHLHREIAALRATLAARQGPAPNVMPGSRRSFKRCGDFWKVIFDGNELHVAHSLGARYLDYLLHHPNQPISAFELELTIAPEKGSARAVNSYGRGNDGEALRRLLRELNRLRAERDDADEQGHFVKAEQLDTEIEALETQLKQSSGQRKHDSGERARNNVRKAIGAVLRGMRSGDVGQKAFAAHVGQFVSTGYTCLYQQAPGAEWA